MFFFSTLFSADNFGGGRVSESGRLFKEGRNGKIKRGKGLMWEFLYRYGHEGVDDNVEFDEDRDGSDDDKEIDVDEI